MIWKDVKRKQKILKKLIEVFRCFINLMKYQINLKNLLILVFRIIHRNFFNSVIS